jgi:hypothetical protein
VYQSSHVAYSGTPPLEFEPYFRKRGICRRSNGVIGDFGPRFAIQDEHAQLAQTALPPLTWFS